MTYKELAELQRRNPDLIVEGMEVDAPVPLPTKHKPQKAITLTILNERAPGWNNVIRAHWVRRQEIVDAIWMRITLKMFDKVYKPFDCIVDVHVAATFKGTPLDSDNICAKLYIDALKGKDRLLHDDNDRFIRRVTTESKRGKANSVTITLTPVDGAKP